MECSMCGQLMLADRIEEHEKDVKLQYPEPYYYCLICFQYVDKKKQTEEYKDKWRIKFLTDFDYVALERSLKILETWF